MVSGSIPKEFWNPLSLKLNMSVGLEDVMSDLHYLRKGSSDVASVVPKQLPLFVAGEIALGLSLVLFVGALIAAIGNRASDGLTKTAAESPWLFCRPDASRPLYC